MTCWIARTAVLFSVLTWPSVVAANDNDGLRTAWGAPNLDGTWDFSTLTPFERPEEFGDKAVLTPEEVQAFIARGQEVLGDERPDDARVDLAGSYNQFWLDFGSDFDNGRTSIIIDPKNGQLPEMTPAASDLLARSKTDFTLPVRLITSPQVSDFDISGPESLSLSDRCLVGFNAGPPITPSAYNNNMRLIQTPDYVVIHTEMVHEARIVPIDKRAHLPQELRFWSGDSIGHWEGDTLVVDTTNFTDKKSAFEVPGFSPPYGTAEDLHLTERFTRIDSDSLEYRFTVTAPSSLARPFTGLITMKTLDGKLYEYACHEGNYSMGGTLRGARIQEQEALQATK